MYKYNEASRIAAALWCYDNCVSWQHGYLLCLVPIITALPICFNSVCHWKKWTKEECWVIAWPGALGWGLINVCFCSREVDLFRDWISLSLQAKYLASVWSISIVAHIIPCYLFPSSVLINIPYSLVLRICAQRKAVNLWPAVWSSGFFFGGGWCCELIVYVCQLRLC